MQCPVAEVYVWCPLRWRFLFIINCSLRA